jgi:hypothetical protein
MAKGAGLMHLAERSWLVRPGGRQGRDHRDGVSLDAVHLLFDLRDLLLQRGMGLLRIAC